MAYYVCSGAKLKCSMGSKASNLCVIHPVEPALVEGHPIAAMLDHKPFLNIKPFGQCKSLANPIVAAATAANYGKLQPMPCVPNTTLPWIGAKMSVRIKGNPALLDTSKLTCMWAGMIEITNPGQKTMKEGCTPLNYYESLIQSEEKAEDVKVTSGNAVKPVEKVKTLTVKDFAEILERIERKNGYESARYYAMYHVDYWRLTNLAKRYVDETDEAKKDEEKDNDPNLMPSRYMLLYGADDGKLRRQGNIDEHPDNFEGLPRHEINVANLRKALILMGQDVEETGQFDEPLFWALLQYIRRFGRAEWNFVNEDEADAEKPLDDVAEKYGLATWKSFYGDECGDGEGGVDHKKVMKKINSTYGDELLKEKGGVPHDYRSSICYRYPWVPFYLTINRSDEEKDTDTDKEIRYEIYDGERYALVAEGKVVDDTIKDLFPDVENPVILVDGVQIWLNPVRSDAPFEEDDGEKKIKKMYWTYGEQHMQLESKHEDSDIWKTNCYSDLNLHVRTKNYNDGDKINITLERDDEKLWSNDASTIEVSGEIINNELVLEKIFEQYTSNQSEQKQKGVISIDPVITATIYDSNNNVLATSRVAKTVSKIEVSIYEIDTKSFVPLGIKDTKIHNKKNNNVKDHIEIKYEIKNKKAKECRIKIFVKDTTLPLKEITFYKKNGKDMCSIGKYTYCWDGFNEEKKYDSREMSKGLRFVIEVQDYNGNTNTAEKEVSVEYVVKWLDVLIDKNEKMIEVWLRVSFKDGGAIGHGRKVPESVVDNDKKSEIQRTIKGFEDLKELAKEGISRYWGSFMVRDKYATTVYNKYVIIADRPYKVYVNVVDIIPTGDKRKNHMSEIKLTFNTNKNWKRSYNPGAARDILSSLVNVFIGGNVFYNVGHYDSEDAAKDDFKESVAHEIGHEILQASVNTWFSYTHKGSSTLWQTTKKEQFYSDNIEIDLMQYYKDEIAPSDYYKRLFTAEEDVLRLIGLIKVGAK